MVIRFAAWVLLPAAAVAAEPVSPAGAEAARFDAAGGSLCWLTKTGKAECVGGPASGAHGSIPTSDSGKTAMKLPPFDGSVMAARHSLSKKLIKKTGVAAS